MSGSHQPGASTVLDPVCGMHVVPEKAPGTAEYKGKKYFFCSVHCAERFVAEPEKFLALRPSPGLIQLGGTSPAKPAQPQTEQPSGQGSAIYVCPMDPAVRESNPRPCPTFC